MKQSFLTLQLALSTLAFKTSPEDYLSVSQEIYRSLGWADQEYESELLEWIDNNWETKSLTMN